MRAENRDRVLTHDRPISVMVYHRSHRQVFTGSQDGTVSVWLVDTGQRLKQFYQVHGDAELTCLRVENYGNRFFTGATDGSIREWDLNGHCYHHFLCGDGGSAEVGDIMPLKRSLVAAGWAKYIAVFRDSDMRQFQVEPADWKGGQEHIDDVVAFATSSANTNLLVSGSCDGEIIVWNSNTETTLRRLSERSRLRTQDRSGVTKSTGDSSMRRKSRANIKSRLAASFAGNEDDFSYTIVKMAFLDTRRGNIGTANLLSCGGAGYVRAWNTGSGNLVGEFVAHEGASSITMAVEPIINNVLATADIEGTIKVWDISNYCSQPTLSGIINDEMPPLISQFKPHTDMVTALEIVERNGRVCIISASYDQTAQLWGSEGRRIGIFGQEDHWRIQKFEVAEKEAKELTPPSSEESASERFDLAAEAAAETEPSIVVDETSKERINIWKNSRLGMEYKEARCRKRERPPLALAMDTMSSQFSATSVNPGRGTFATLNLHYMPEVEAIEKPDSLRTQPIHSTHLPEGFGGTTRRQRFPVGQDSTTVPSLKTAFDDRSLFPKFILEHEHKMHQQLQQMIVKDAEKEKHNIMTATTSDGMTSHLDSAMSRVRVGTRGSHPSKR